MACIRLHDPEFEVPMWHIEVDVLLLEQRAQRLRQLENGLLSGLQFVHTGLQSHRLLHFESEQGNFEHSNEQTKIILAFVVIKSVVKIL